MIVHQPHLSVIGLFYVRSKMTETQRAGCRQSASSVVYRYFEERVAKVLANAGYAASAITGATREATPFTMS